MFNTCVRRLDLLFLCFIGNVCVCCIVRSNVYQTLIFLLIKERSASLFFLIFPSFSSSSPFPPKCFCRICVIALQKANLKCKLEVLLQFCVRIDMLLSESYRSCIPLNYFLPSFFSWLMK